jgi:hypothetical protein
MLVLRHEAATLQWHLDVNESFSAHGRVQIPMIFVLSRDANGAEAASMLLATRHGAAPMLMMTPHSCCSVARTAARAKNMDACQGSWAALKNCHDPTPLGVTEAFRLVSGKGVAFDEASYQGMCPSSVSVGGPEFLSLREEVGFATAVAHVVTGVLGALGRTLCQTLLASEGRRGCVTWMSPVSDLTWPFEQTASTVASWRRTKTDEKGRVSLVFGSVGRAVGGAAIAVSTKSACQGGVLKVSHSTGIVLATLAANETLERLMASLGIHGNYLSSAIHQGDKVGAVVVFSSFFAFLGRCGLVGRFGTNATVDGAVTGLRQIGG